MQRNGTKNFKIINTIISKYASLCVNPQKVESTQERVLLLDLVFPGEAYDGVVRCLHLGLTHILHVNGLTYIA